MWILFKLLILFRIVILDNTDFMHLLQEFHDNDTNAVMLSNHITWKYFNLVNSPHRRLGITSDRMFMYCPVFYFHKKSILRPVFDEEFLKLRETGLTQYWIKKYIDDRITKQNRAPERLKLINVLGAFEVCILMYSISIIVFIFELLSSRYRRTKRFLDFLTYYWWLWWPLFLPIIHIWFHRINVTCD